MTAWREEAIRLRVEENTGLTAISKTVGKSTRMVAKVLKGYPMDRAPWRPKAREMRAAGAKIRDIAQEVNRSEAEVTRAVRDVDCPINHKADQARAMLPLAHTPAARAKAVETRRLRYPPNPKQSRPPKPRKERVPLTWWAEARQMRADGMKVEDIALKVGKSKHRTGEIVKDVFCPIDHRMEALRRAVAASVAARIARPKKIRIRKKYVPKPLTAEQKRRQRVTNLLARDRMANRKPAPITLPQLSFLL